MEAIFYDGRLAAITTAERVFLPPEVEQLESGDPWLRMVVGMCLYARDVERGLVPGPYSRDQAEFFARVLFMPEHEFKRAQASSDEELARRFRMPIGEVAKRRSEL